MKIKVYMRNYANNKPYEEFRVVEVPLSLAQAQLLDPRIVGAHDDGRPQYELRCEAYVEEEPEKDDEHALCWLKGLRQKLSAATGSDWSARTRGRGTLEAWPTGRLDLHQIRCAARAAGEISTLAGVNVVLRRRNGKPLC